MNYARWVCRGHRLPLWLAQAEERARAILSGSERRSYAFRSFTGQVGFAAVAFVGSVLAARLLGVEGKGELTAWTLVTALGALLLSGTIPVGLGRSYLAGHRKQYRRAIALHGCVAVAVVLPLIIAVPVAGLSAVAILSFVIVGVPAGVVEQDLLPLLQASRRPWSYQAIRLVSASGLVIGLIFVVAFVPDASRDLRSAIAWLSYGAGSFASACLALLLVGRLGVRRGDRVSLVQAARQGRGSFITALTDWGLLRLDQVIVAAIAGPAALGIYSVAVNWTEIGQYIGHSMGQAVFEDVGDSTRRQKTRIIRQIVTTVGLSMVPVVVAGFALVPVIFGVQFSAARWLIVLLAPGVVARSAAYAGSQMLLGSGRGRESGAMQLVTLSVSVPVWCSAIVVGGLPLMAVASTAAYFLQFGLTRWCLLKTGEVAQ